MQMMGPEQLGRLMDDHAAALALFARQWCASPEDVVQEAFVKLAGQRPAPADAVAWLYKVVRNGALGAARPEQRRRRHEARAAGLGDGLDAEAATRALEALPLEQREVLVARLWGGLTFEQIAALTGLSGSAAHRHYHAGLASLRERLRVPCPDHTRMDR